MKIAVLSGKGGTGKTFISVNLASVMTRGTYVDCDVEEPNGHLFFQPVWLKTLPVSRKMPFVDQEKCTGCKTCVDFCKFNAMAYIGDKVMIFEDICHSCGGCALICPEDAIKEKDKDVGKIQIGKSLKTNVITGTMKVKEASGVPIIHQLLEEVRDREDVVIDCPPGSACTVMESIKDADYCLLVGEPTIFGRHNLAMVHELVELHHKPYSVVLNKCVDGHNPTKDYCIDHHMKIIKEIPYDSTLATLLSNGRIPAREKQQYYDDFLDLLHLIANDYKESKIMEAVK